MPVYVWCPKCGAEYSAINKKCPKCGTLRPKRGAFRVRVVYKKETVRKLFTGITLSDAREIEAKIKQELIEGKYIERETRKIIPTLNEFTTEYYLPYEKNNKKGKSYARDEQLYRDYIEPLLGKKKLDSISKIDVEKLKEKVSHLSERSIEYCLGVLRHIYNRALEMGFVKNNPVIGIRIPRRDNKRIRFLSIEEEKKLLDELKKSSIDTYEIAFLSLYTGMRFGEIARLSWEDVDFKRNLLYIKDPKNKENRVIYMIKNVKSMLLERQKRTKKRKGLVFPNRNGEERKEPPKTFARVVKRIGLNKGITDTRNKVVFHTLRHTFASRLAEKGIQMQVIKELLGHKTLAMTERYSHLAPDTKKQALQDTFEDIKTLYDNRKE